jgi:hypothetical protein
VQRLAVDSILVLDSKGHRDPDLSSIATGPQQRFLLGPTALLENCL